MKPLTKATLAAWTTSGRRPGGAAAAAAREPPEETISARPGGAFGSSSESFESTRDWKIAPREATPVAIPTWRKVVLIPEPIPAFSTGTTAIAAWPMPGLVDADPDAGEEEARRAAPRRPSRRRAPCISNSPTPTRPRPTPSRTRIGTRLESEPAIGEAMKERTVSGRKRRPASSGEKSSTPCM